MKQRIPLLGNNLKKGINDLLKRILYKYNITLNYYIISILFMIIFTFILIQITGENILNHESYILKKEFLEQNMKYTKELADRIGSYMENLDTLSIVDTIDRLSKEGLVVLAYVLNGNGEVVAHSVKSEMFKKYQDPFLNKKNLKIISDNVNKVWSKEEEYKGISVVKFSRPVLLQFAKKEVINELEMSQEKNAESSFGEGFRSKVPMSNKIVMPESVVSSKDLTKKFYVAGVVHAVYSTEKLSLISSFSRRAVLIYYFTSYLLAIFLGYVIGRIIETSMKKANLQLSAILRDEEVKPINFQFRVDSFKKIFYTINQLVFKFSDYSSSFQSRMDDSDATHDRILEKLGDHVHCGLLITDKYLKIEFINPIALSFLGKKMEECINDNLEHLFQKDAKLIGEINTVVSGKLQDEAYSFNIGDTRYSLFPILTGGRMIKLLIIFESKGMAVKGKKQENEVREPAAGEKEEKPAPAKDESAQSKIESRLKRI
ncbi:MAG: hypothetical protein PHF84_12490 [bacterium]|nr:hypothetical protein [bacterium]